MPYACCPKCGHAKLPEDQALPAACPACGLVLAKYGTAPVGSSPSFARAAHETSEAESRTTRDWLAAWLFHVPDKVSKTSWSARAAALAVLVLWTLWIWADVDIRGGKSLGQHLMPIVLGYALLVRRRDPFGAAIFFWLLGYSTIDMAVYMYDAFDPKLMLLGGATGAESDGHDWQNTFGDLGLLRRARGIGLFFGGLGMAMMLAALSWAARVLWLQRARLSDSLFAASDIK